MNTNKKTKLFFLITLLVVTVSTITSWTTLQWVHSYQKTKNENTSDNEMFRSNQNAKVRFANATSGLETDFTIAADLSVHAVVHIKTQTIRHSSSSQDFFNDPFFEFFFGPQQKPQPQTPTEKSVPMGSGSGVIISPNGYIVTNNHVVEGATEIQVTLNDKRTFKAQLIGTDPSTDVALLKIEAEKLPSIAFGNSDNIKVGEWVLAVGNPFNLTSTVTAGIVSAKARNIGIIGKDRYGRKKEKLSIESFIQTDAAINPGNSGGALVNTAGELIGINTAIASRTGSYAGYGFAIPTSIVKKVVTDLREHGVVQRALLGVQISDITTDIAKEKNLKTLNGVLVGGVVPNGAAQKAGIKTNDVIIEIDKTKITSSAKLQEQIGLHRPGDKIYVVVLRENKKKKFIVKLTNSEGTTDIVETKKYEKELGIQIKPIGDVVKQAIGIDAGLEITQIQEGAFRQQGINVSFIILKINNQKMKTIADFEKLYQKCKKNKQPLNIAGVYPTSGKIGYYKINLK